MNVLNIYPNCSLGGISTVYQNRILANPQVSFDFIFTNDMRGKIRYDQFENVNVRIIDAANLQNYLKYAFKIKHYDIVMVCQYPALLPLINACSPNSALFYEIHTSIPEDIERDVKAINDSRLEAVLCPSQWLKTYIENSINFELKHAVRVVENLLTDYSQLPPSDMDFKLAKRKGQTPVLWVGRAHPSAPKNFHDFFQIIAALPDNYYGIIVLSYETQPYRLAKLLSFAAQYNISDRLEIFMDLETRDMKNLYSAVKARNGLVCSTSLCESFGYVVREAAQLGLPVVSYNVGPLASFTHENFYPAETGDIEYCINKIMELKA